MRQKISKGLRSAILASTLTVLGSTAAAENVVIALKTNPLVDPEAACVALQIGQNLMMPIGGRSAEKVTLFPTLDGVEIVSDWMLPVGTKGKHKRNKYPRHLECRTPNGHAPLAEVLKAFWEMGGEIVVCPLCWGERYPDEEPIYGVIADGLQIHNLFLDADKVIDF